MTLPLTFDTIIPVLLQRVPELRSVYQWLLDGEGPPVGPYALVGSAVPFAYELCRTADRDPTRRAAAHDALRRLFEVLAEMDDSRDQFLIDLAGTGFLEVMDPDDPCFEHLMGLMPPSLAGLTWAMFGPGSGWRRRLPDGSLGPPR